MMTALRFINTDPHHISAAGDSIAPIKLPKLLRIQSAKFPESRRRRLTQRLAPSTSATSMLALR